MTRKIDRPSRSVWAVLLAVLLAVPASAARDAPVSVSAPATQPARQLPFTLDPNPSTYKPLPSVETLIVGAVLLDGAGGRIDDAFIRLKDGKVVSTGPRSALPAGATAAAGVTVIEAGGKWVTPGIIDVHSHNGTFTAPMVANSDVSEESDPNVANVWVEHSIHAQDPSFSRALAAGVTTLQVLPGSGNLFGGRSVVVKPVWATDVQAMKFPDAPQGLKMACGDNPKNANKFPTSRMGGVAGMRDAWMRAQAYREKWEKWVAGGAGEAPVRDLKLDTLAAVLRGEIRVHIHCYRSSDLNVMLGVANEFHYRVTAFHHASEAYKVIPQLRAAGTCAAVWADWWGWKMEAMDGIRENAAMLEQAGACVMMHSDSPALGQRLHLEAEKAIAAGHRAGIDILPEQAIRWITSNPAKALGLDDRIGTLAAGRNADLVLWSGTPFSVFSKAEQVFVDGAVAFDRNDPKRQPRSDFEVGQELTDRTGPVCPEDEVH